MSQELQRVTNPYDKVQSPTSMVAGGAQGTNQIRSIAEVQAIMTVARKFPRDERSIMDRLLTIDASMPAIAEKAEYCYARGGAEITGITAIAMRAIACRWGNIDYGIREVKRDTQAGQSELEAVVIDMETMARSSIGFVVSHTRHTKNGSTRLLDDRDIYEHVMNQGGRRLRKCLENVIPYQVQDAFVKACRSTMASLESGLSKAERIEKVLAAFAEVGVSKEEIEAYLQHNVSESAMEEVDFSRLRRVLRGIKDGFTTADNEFRKGAGTEAEEAREGFQEPGQDPGTGEHDAFNSAPPGPVSTGPDEQTTGGRATSNPAASPKQDEGKKSGFPYDDDEVEFSKPKQEESGEQEKPTNQGNQESQESQEGQKESYVGQNDRAAAGIPIDPNATYDPPEDAIPPDGVLWSRRAGLWLNGKAERVIWDPAIHSHPVDQETGKPAGVGKLDGDGNWVRRRGVDKKVMYAKEMVLIGTRKVLRSVVDSYVSETGAEELPKVWPPGQTDIED